MQGASYESLVCRCVRKYRDQSACVRVVTVKSHEIDGGAVLSMSHTVTVTILTARACLETSVFRAVPRELNVMSYGAYVLYCECVCLLATTRKVLPINPSRKSLDVLILSNGVVSLGDGVELVLVTGNYHELSIVLYEEYDRRTRPTLLSP